MKKKPATKRAWAARCPRCETHIDLCFCSEFKCFPLKTWVSVVMHVREKTLVTNTARLMQNILPHSNLIEHGVPGRSLEDVKAELLPLRGTPVILFPAPESKVLRASSDLLASGPFHLIVPDGNWSNGRKLFNRLRQLVPEAHCMQLDPASMNLKSQYRLRSSERAEALSTYEAIALALDTLEALPANTLTEMMTLFKLKVERTLQTRGR